MLNLRERKEVERSLLGSMLNYNEIFIQAQIVLIKPESFKDTYCKIIYSKMLSFYRETQSIPDPASLYDYIFLKNQIGDEKLKAALIELQTKASYNKSHLIGVLQDDNAEGEMREVISQISKSEEKGLDLLINTQEKLSQITFKYMSSVSKERSNYEIADAVIADLTKTRAGEKSDYIPSGFSGIDKKIIGFHKKSISIIAARPGIGKTAFLLQLKRNFIKQGYKVGIFSLEMDAESLLIRDLADRTEIDSLNIESGNLSDNQFDDIVEKASEIVKLPYIIDDSPHHNVESLKTRINSWRMTNKADVIFIDYLTLIKTAVRKDSRPDLAIGAITEELRKFAKQHSIPIIVISQLNRKLEDRADKKPILADLKDSGNIEQDARVVLFLYRADEYGLNPFNNGTTFYTKSGEPLDKEEYCEIIISKARNGRTGIVPIRYIRKFHRFEDLSIGKITKSADNDYPW